MIEYSKFIKNKNVQNRFNVGDYPLAYFILILLNNKRPPKDQINTFETPFEKLNLIQQKLEKLINQYFSIINENKLETFFLIDVDSSNIGGKRLGFKIYRGDHMEIQDSRENAENESLIPSFEKLSIATNCNLNEEMNNLRENIGDVYPVFSRLKIVFTIFSTETQAKLIKNCRISNIPNIRQDFENLERKIYKRDNLGKKWALVCQEKKIFNSVNVDEIIKLNQEKLKPKDKTDKNNMDIFKTKEKKTKRMKFDRSNKITSLKSVPKEPIQKDQNIQKDQSAQKDSISDSIVEIIPSIRARVRNDIKVPDFNNNNNKFFHSPHAFSIGDSNFTLSQKLASINKGLNQGKGQPDLMSTPVLKDGPIPFDNLNSVTQSPYVSIGDPTFKPSDTIITTDSSTLSTAVTTESATMIPHKKNQTKDNNVEIEVKEEAPSKEDVKIVVNRTTVDQSTSVIHKCDNQGYVRNVHIWELDARHYDFNVIKDIKFNKFNKLYQKIRNQDKLLIFKKMMNRGLNVENFDKKYDKGKLFIT